ncbi:MAG: bile acid:sodium symporter family protein [Aquificota bacterium]|nr:MAG: bile acid:sodium symporter family protein [Aquificota bacterium]
MQPVISFLILLFFSLLGLIFKDFFAGMKDLIVPLLALVMLSMGIALKDEELKELIKKPYQIAYGALLQFSIMPLLGYFLGLLLATKREFLFGAVLVGSAPGGTASNLITYLSKGNLAYSIGMTSFSTLLSPLATPSLVYLLIGQRVEVPFLPMLKDLLLIVFLPVVGGMLLRRLLPNTRKLEPALPYLSITIIGLIVGVVFALNSDKLKAVNGELLLLVVLHNWLGFLLGYTFALLVGMDRVRAKTVSVEVGMQNSGLAAVLALKYFPPETALPSALFSLVQNISGIALSFLYRRL